MKLALVISSLGGGGAERVMSTLANGWVRHGVHITLITLSSIESDIYSLDPNIERIGLDLSRPSANFWHGFKNNLRRIRAIRKAIRMTRPDAVLSFMTTTNILTLLACPKARVPVVVSERISVADQPPRGIWGFLSRCVYRRAAAVVAQTQSGAAWLERMLNLPIQVIPNPLHLAGPKREAPEMEALLQIPAGARLLVAMGRLDAQKGFDLLLEAFAQVAPAHPGWVLLILGEGPERIALEAQARNLGLGDHVRMPGFVEKPHIVMCNAHAFVMSSRYEGMPNALLEAMACGLPCASFDCRTGPAEIIEHDVNGLLVPPEDVDTLADVLARLMDDASLRKRLGTEARAVRTLFNIDTVLAQWNDLLASVIGRNTAAHQTVMPV